MGAIEHYSSLFRERRGALPGAGLPWLDASRASAMAQFVASGLPGPRDEEWKYTSLRTLDSLPFAPAAAPCIGMDLDDIAHLRCAGPGTHLLTFLNGHFTPALSRPGMLPAGVSLKPLNRALAEDAPLLEAQLGRLAGAGNHGLAALNTALAQDGAILSIADGVTLDQPVECLFLSTGQEAHIASHFRLLVLAGRQSRATVLESFAQLGTGAAAHLNSITTELSLGDGAQLDHYKIQQEGAGAYHFATLAAALERDSRLVSHQVALGALLARTGIDVQLNAPGAVCELNGLYVTGGRQHVDFHTRVNHWQPHGTSREYYKGILDGRSRAVFNGVAVVHPGADKTDARQSNRNLLLSPDAEADTKPQLEIFADDVKCSHGATVGQLDEQMLFYLRSRGLGEQQARALLVYGFAHDVVDRMGLEAVRAHLEQVLVHRLPGVETAPVA
jgi:Fe-S cluster assembly protein SufD